MFTFPRGRALSQPIVCHATYRCNYLWIPIEQTTAHIAGNFVQARRWHGLALVHVDNKPRVLAIGGQDHETNYLHRLDSIEMWNPATETWKLTEMKLNHPKADFGFLSVPTGLICS